MQINATDTSRKPPRSLVGLLEYKNKDGYHVFSSRNVEGLLIVSKDPKSVHEQLKPTIEALLNHNYGGDWVVQIADELTAETMENGASGCEMKSKYLIAENQEIQQAA